MDYSEIMGKVLHLESEALALAAKRLNQWAVQRTIEIFQSLMNDRGTLFFCGVGKSGFIASKLASSFSSLGLPSYHLHPVEALHGDLGRVSKNDAIVLISKSGATEEILKLLPFLMIDKSRRIALLGKTTSPIAQECDVVYDCSVKREACINNQAPTTSSTLALAMGDAMAVAYETMIGLSKETFAINHPGGILGKNLRVKVEDMMLKLERCPVVGPEAKLQDVILEMTKIPAGGCAIIGDNHQLLGIMVEGDIRRTFTHPSFGLHTNVAEIMTKKPITIGPDELAYTALKLMESTQKAISLIPVINSEKRFLGFIRGHDLIREGFFTPS